jgi:hypothetical protein
MRSTPNGCAQCGRALSDHDRHVRFELPGAVLGNRALLEAPDAWLSHADAFSSVMMQLPGVGHFVRAVLPVRFAGGSTTTFGVWVGVSPPDLLRAFGAWWEDDYVELELDGHLANDVGPWELVGVPVRLEVRDRDHLPYCVSSSHEMLDSVLSLAWPDEAIALVGGGLTEGCAQ